MRGIRPASVVLLLALASGARAQDKPRPDEKAAEAGTTERRIEELEKRLREQQEQIDRLVRDREAEALQGKDRERPGPPAPVPAPPGAEKPDEEFELKLGYDEGFFIKGRIHGAAYVIRPRVGIQIDYRVFLDAVPNNQFNQRRARVGFDGTFGVFAFDIGIQPLRAGIPLVDCWLEYRQFEAARIRAGHYKTPFSIDNGMIGDFRTDFIERPMVLGSGGSVAPDFRPGAEVLGDFSGGLFRYWISVQNQLDSNNNVSSDPLYCARVESEYKGLCVGAAGYWEKLAGQQPSFSLFTPGQFRFFVPVGVSDWTQAYEVDLAVYHGPVWFRGEFVYAHQERKKSLSNGTRDGTGLVTQGAYGQVGWLFWGPRPEVERPAIPFRDWVLFSADLEKRKNKRNVGAELLVRVEWVKVDDARGGRRALSGGFSPPSTAANADDVDGVEAVALTAGFNLMPIENVLIQLNYVRLRIGDRDRSERRNQRHGDEFLVRAQLEF